MGPLVDTSVLIDYFNGVASRESDRLDQLLDRGPAPSTAPLIVQEFLQGLRGADAAHAASALDHFDRLEAPSYAVHEDAATLARRFRSSGNTSSTVDTLIVQMAVHHGVMLLTRDRMQADLARFARVRLA